MATNLQRQLVEILRQIEEFDHVLLRMRQLAASDELNEDQRARVMAIVKSAEATKMGLLDAVGVLNNEEPSPGN